MTISEAKLVFFIPTFDFERGKSNFFGCAVVIVARGIVAVWLSTKAATYLYKSTTKTSLTTTSSWKVRPETGGGAAGKEKYFETGGGAAGKGGELRGGGWLVMEKYFERGGVLEKERGGVE
ncbi:hypothetical protein OIU84_006921 [Salix udensis]|uniref:Uncharacterized protein n=1 Tax=Salix udensis TaxID=889485 RepID=A0AAD6P2S0_9ROSI|nr:hypothetical protein OIU84_006921 [Salix udensis]